MPCAGRWARPGQAAVGSARSRGTARALRAAAAVAGLAVIGGHLAIALARVGYPGHLEILEDNSLIEMRRILAGQQIYVAPSAGYAPDGYPPLYFAVSAAAASVLGQSYPPLRLVSIAASLACFAVLGRLIQRETRPDSHNFTVLLTSLLFVAITQQSACQTRESLLLNAKVPYAAVTAGMGGFPGAPSAPGAPELLALIVGDPCEKNRPSGR